MHATTDDELIPLPAVPKLIAQLTRRRKRPHIRTVYRWAETGVRGRILRTCPLGGTLATRREWLDEFFAERSAGTTAPTRTSTPGRTTRPMSQSEHDAETERYRRELQNAGVL